MVRGGERERTGGDANKCGEEAYTLHAVIEGGRGGGAGCWRLARKAIGNMNNDEEKRNIEDVIAEERSRGRRPAYREPKRKRQIGLRTLRKALRTGSEREYLNALRALGLQEGSPEFAKARQLWFAWRRS